MLFLSHEMEQMEQDLSHFGALEMVLGDVAHAALHQLAFGCALRAEIDHIQHIRTGQQLFPPALYIREAIEGVLVPQDEAHNAEQVR